MSGLSRGTRTSSRVPEAWTSNSASPANSITTRAVRAPAGVAPIRRTVPSSTSCSRGTPTSSASAKSSTRRGGPERRSVVKLSGLSPMTRTTAVSASPPARNPTIRANRERPAIAGTAPSAAAIAIKTTGGVRSAQHRTRCRVERRTRKR